MLIRLRKYYLNLMRSLLLCVLYASVIASDCIYKNTMNAGSSPIITAQVVNGIITQQVQPLITGLQVEDLQKLNSNAFFYAAFMKINSIAWCTARSNNKGRLVML